ncbi:MAG: hypothetical protein NTY09_14250, partial [bacterium]|nr:hypothetical protein [bacterium]
SLSYKNESTATLKILLGNFTCAVLIGQGESVHRGYEMRVMRDGEKVAEVKISSLKRFKDDVREVESGLECGIMLEGFTDLREGDHIIIFEIIKVLRTLEGSRKKE